MKFQNPKAITANQICWIREIEFYIRQIHILNGGVDDEWLKDYIKLVLNDWANQLLQARDCFMEVFKRTKELRSVSHIKF